MRAVVDAKEFSKALDKVSKAVRKSKYIPVLEEVLVQFRNGRCVLTGTDLETWLTTEIPARGDDFAFAFYRTASAVKACRRFDGKLTMELTGISEGRNRQLKLNMSCGNRVGEFHAFFPEEYPELPQLEVEHSFQVNASHMMARINQIKYATLKPSTDASACSTSIQFKDSKIYCLDGLRAAWSTDEALSVPKPFLAPAASLEYLRVFGKQDVSVRFDRRYVDITDETTHLIFHQVEAVPFDLDSAIPKDFREEVCFCPDEFLSELAYLKDLMPVGQKLYFRFGNGRLASYVDGCRYQTKIWLDGESRIEIGFNLQHMADALRQFKGETRVRMKLIAPSSPVLLEAEGRSDCAMVLPARLTQARIAV